MEWRIRCSCCRICSVVSSSGFVAGANWLFVTSVSLDAYFSPGASLAVRGYCGQPFRDCGTAVPTYWVRVLSGGRLRALSLRTHPLHMTEQVDRRSGIGFPRLATGRRNAENKQQRRNFAPTGSLKFSVIQPSTIGQKSPSVDGPDAFSCW